MGRGGNEKWLPLGVYPKFRRLKKGAPEEEGEWDLEKEAFLRHSSEGPERTEAAPL